MVASYRKQNDVGAVAAEVMSSVLLQAARPLRSVAQNGKTDRRSGRVSESFPKRERIMTSEAFPLVILTQAPKGQTQTIRVRCACMYVIPLSCPPNKRCDGCEGGKDGRVACGFTPCPSVAACLANQLRDAPPACAG